MYRTRNFSPWSGKRSTDTLASPCGTPAAFLPSLSPRRLAPRRQRCAVCSPPSLQSLSLLYAQTSPLWMHIHSNATGPGPSPVPSGPRLGTAQVLQFSDGGVTVSPPQAARRTGTNTVFVKSQSDTHRRQDSHLCTRMELAERGKWGEGRYPRARHGRKGQLGQRRLHVSRWPVPHPLIARSPYAETRAPYPTQHPPNARTRDWR